MKTPDEIKKGLDICIGEDERCAKCSYVCYGDCRTALEVDALKYIQQLERERDAAVSLLDGECYACLHNEDGEPCRTKEICQCCVYNEDAWGMDLDYNWQWRGVQNDG